MNSGKEPKMNFYDERNSSLSLAFSVNMGKETS